jgi:outer membrane protein assembly factor BamD (BamD/ComL family)
LSGRERIIRGVAIRFLAAVLLASAAIQGWTGCSSQSRFEGLGAEGEFLEGQRLYEDGRCLQAVEALQRFLSNHPGSARVDDAIYYLGLSHECMGEHVLAREEFDRLLREFPQSDNREETEWRLALTYFDSRHDPDRDPEPTEQAITEFEKYLRHYPQGVHAEEAARNIRTCHEELAKKEFENGETYFELLDAWDAAIIYYEKSLEILSDSKVAGIARARLAQVYAEKGDPENAELWRQRLAEYATAERLAADRSLAEQLEDASAAVEKARRKKEELAREAEQGTDAQGSAPVDSAVGERP